VSGILSLVYTFPVTGANEEEATWNWGTRATYASGVPEWRYLVTPCGRAKPHRHVVAGDATGERLRCVGGAPACYVVGKWSCESDSHPAGTVVLIYPRFFITWMLAHKFPLLFNVQGK